jgi:uncharacterized protein YwgA
MSVNVPPEVEVERRGRLAAFVSFLKKELGCEFDLHGNFDDRLRLQKYVFLADRYGLKSGYEFSMYVRGPYSPRLAEDYYKPLEVETSLPIDFRSQDFIKLVAGKDPKWLEIAATAISVYEYNKEKGINREEITEIVTEIKPWAKDCIKEVLDELVEANLIKLP